MEVRAWQPKAVEELKLYRSLLVKGLPGAGKSFVGKCANIALGKTIVITPTRQLVKQWRDEYHVHAITVQSALKFEEIKVKLLVLDECHHYESEVWSQIHSIVKCEYTLGLSATPGNSYERYSHVFEVPLEEIKLPPVKFFYHYFDLDIDAREQYDRLSREIQAAKLEDPGSNRSFFLSLQRRRVVFNSNARWIALKDSLPYLLGERNLVLCESVISAERIARFLGTVCVHYKQNNDNVIGQFSAGKLKTLVAVKMASEGMNCVDVDTVILAESALSDTKFVQSIGRGLRFVQGKHLHIHLYMARNTSDMVLKINAERFMQDIM